MPRFFDDYSNTYLTHDSSAGRKQQRRGWKFRENFKIYYEKYVDEWRAGPYGLAAAQQAYLKARGEAEAPPLPEGWSSEVDEATGITFYTNEKTGRRTWVRPNFRPPALRGPGGPGPGGGGPMGLPGPGGPRGAPPPHHRMGMGPMGGGGPPMPHMGMNNMHGGAPMAHQRSVGGIPPPNFMQPPPIGPPGNHRGGPRGVPGGGAPPGGGPPNMPPPPHFVQPPPSIPPPPGGTGAPLPPTAR